MNRVWQAPGFYMENAVFLLWVDMKKKTIISAVILLLLQFFLTANSLVLTYSQKVRSRDLDVRLNTESIAYRMTIRQNNDGSFTLLSPPFLVAEFNNALRVGELKDARLLSLMLDPMSSGLDYSGFRKGNNFNRITTPSISPRLSGLALSFSNLDVFAFTPVLNPQSPSGFGLIAGTANVFAGVLCATQNRMVVRSSAQDYQVNWRQLGIGKNMLFSIIGASADSEFLGTQIKSTIFLQNAFDALLGGGTTIGWSMGAETDLLNFSFFRKTGGFGVKLKRLTDDLSPKVSFGAELSATSPSDKDLSFEAGYRSDTYEMPVYGGNSQRRELTYEVGTSWKKNSIKVANKISYDLDRGKVQTTEYVLKLEDFGAEIEASFTLNRPLGAPCYPSGAKLKVNTEHAKLTASDNKVLLEMNWKLAREDYELSFSIDQDRRITASLSFRGL